MQRYRERYVCNLQQRGGGGRQCVNSEDYRRALQVLATARTEMQQTDSRVSWLWDQRPKHIPYHCDSQDSTNQYSPNEHTFLAAVFCRLAEDRCCCCFRWLEESATVSYRL